MRVRCGRCQAAFEVTGPGRFSCPACGTVNEVRAEAGTPGGDAPVWTPPAPTPPSPSPRVTCPGCGFQFIVGDVETAICPNCRQEVRVGSDEGAAS